MFKQELNVITDLQIPWSGFKHQMAVFGQKW